ncbi:MAG: cold-shock protein [Gaiellaceae bacterium]
MPTGRVKWFNDARGFGFIVNEAGGPEVFVHYTGIAGGGHRSLHADARVTFELREGRKGLEAYDVRPFTAPPRPAPTVAGAGRPRKRFALPRRHGA